MGELFCNELGLLFLIVNEYFVQWILNICRTLDEKAERIVDALQKGGAVPAEGGTVPAGIKDELSAFKNAQSLVQHQLQDLR